MSIPIQVYLSGEQMVFVRQLLARFLNVQRSQRIGLILALAGILVFSYQNCGKGFRVGQKGFSSLEAGSQGPIFFSLSSNDLYPNDFPTWGEFVACQRSKTTPADQDVCVINYSSKRMNYYRDSYMQGQPAPSEQAENAAYANAISQMDSLTSWQLLSLKLESNKTLVATQLQNLKKMLGEKLSQRLTQIKNQSAAQNCTQSGGTLSDQGICIRPYILQIVETENGTRTKSINIRGTGFDNTAKVTILCDNGFNSYRLAPNFQGDTLRVYIDQPASVGNCQLWVEMRNGSQTVMSNSKYFRIVPPAVTTPNLLIESVLGFGTQEVRGQMKQAYSLNMRNFIPANTKIEAICLPVVSASSSVYNSAQWSPVEILEVHERGVIVLINAPSVDHECRMRAADGANNHEFPFLVHLSRYVPPTDSSPPPEISAAFSFFSTVDSSTFSFVMSVYNMAPLSVEKNPLEIRCKGESPNSEAVLVPISDLSLVNSFDLRGKFQFRRFSTCVMTVKRGSKVSAPYTLNMNQVVVFQPPGPDAPNIFYTYIDGFDAVREKHIINIKGDFFPPASAGPSRVEARCNDQVIQNYSIDGQGTSNFDYIIIGLNADYNQSRKCKFTLKSAAGNKISEEIVVPKAIRAASPPFPKINSAQDSRFSAGSNRQYVVLFGENFSAVAGQNKVVITFSDGQSIECKLGSCLEYESPSQINFYVPVSPNERSGISISITSGSLSSAQPYRDLKLVAFVAATLPQIRDIKVTSQDAVIGRVNLEATGDNFSAAYGSNTVTVVCGAERLVLDRTFGMLSESATKVGFHLSTAPLRRECSAAITTPGGNSNIFSFSIEPSAISAPHISEIRELGHFTEGGTQRHHVRIGGKDFLPTGNTVIFSCGSQTLNCSDSCIDPQFKLSNLIEMAIPVESFARSCQVKVRSNGLESNSVRVDLPPLTSSNIPKITGINSRVDSANNLHYLEIYGTALEYRIQVSCGENEFFQCSALSTSCKLTDTSRTQVNVSFSPSSRARACNFVPQVVTVGGKILEGSPFSYTIPAFTAVTAPTISSISPSVNFTKQMLLINGTGYVANQNQVFINCVGQNQIICSQRGGSPCSIESESATNISVSFDTSTSDRSCEVAVSSRGSNSALYRNLSIPRFGAPPPPPPVVNNPVIASIQAAGTIKSERMTYLTFWGSHFGGVGQNTITASCGGSYTCTNSGSDCRITSESSGQINLRLPASPSSRSCSFTVKSNGLDSQSAQFSVEAFTVKTEMLKASGQNMRNWYQWNWYYNQVTGSEAPSVEVEDPAEDVSLDLWCASAQGNCDKMP